ncbi:MAG: hypothetical protein ACK5Q5_05710 [Planctomycetaceae bacterium]
MTDIAKKAPTVDRYVWWILAMNTLAFTMCIAVWMMNGLLVTCLVDNARYGPSHKKCPIEIVEELLGVILFGHERWNASDGNGS